MDWLRILLETSPMTTLFLVIATGYPVGEVDFKGFALGSGAVLFVGLVCGAFAPKAAPPGMLGTLGLLLFLYSVGIQYGGDWPSVLRQSAPRWATLWRRTGRSRSVSSFLCPASTLAGADRVAYDTPLWRARSCGCG